ncbi:unnamed protein product [Arabidopsis halleri]
MVLPMRMNLFMMQPWGLAIYWSLPLLLPAAEDGISMIIGVSVKVLWNCLGIYCSRLENERMYYYSITTEKCLNTCGFDVATFLSTNVESVCKSLLGPMGLMSPKTPEQQAAVYSLSTMMSLAPEVTFTVFKMHLQDLPDRLSHNMLSETDIKIFHTPEGMLLSEQGIYVAQTMGAKYTKQEPVLTWVYSTYSVLHLKHDSTFSILDLMTSSSYCLL